MIFKKETIEKDISKILGFKTEECETVNIQKRITSSCFKLSTGEDTIVISTYSQIDINAGLYCGMPNDLTRYFQESVEIASNYFKDKPVFFIKPIVYEDDIPQGHGSKIAEKGFLLPSVLTLALVDKDNTLLEDTGSEHHASSIRLAWWQDGFGLPSENIIEFIKNLEWKSPYAWSWSY